jgi:hypothetical protein
VLLTVAVWKFGGERQQPKAVAQQAPVSSPSISNNNTASAMPSAVAAPAAAASTADVSIGIEGGKSLGIASATNIPPGWSRHEDDEGNTYYVHADTETSVWEGEEFPQL